MLSIHPSRAAAIAAGIAEREASQRVAAGIAERESNQPVAAGPAKHKSKQPAAGGIPFKRMFVLRGQLDKAKKELNQINHEYKAVHMLKSSTAKLGRLRKDLESKSAEIEDMEKRLKPMEANYYQQTRKAAAVEESRPTAATSIGQRTAGSALLKRKRPNDGTEYGRLERESPVHHPRREPVDNPRSKRDDNARLDRDLFGKSRAEPTAQKMENDPRSERDLFDKSRAEPTARKREYELRSKRDRLGIPPIESTSRKGGDFYPPRSKRGRLDIPPIESTSQKGGDFYPPRLERGHFDNLRIDPTPRKSEYDPRSERDFDDNPRAEQTHPNRLHSEPRPVVKESMINTGTLEVLPPGGCTLSADGCQYAHLERLRRQYARPMELFCEEMDSINDSCLTGLSLAMPDMPWSVVMSRLAFLFKTTVDGDNSGRSTLAHPQALAIGTTIGCGQHVRYIKLSELMTIQDWRDFTRWAHHQSHVFNLCGQQNCIKLKHMCMEPIDCLTSRNMCQKTFNSRYNGKRLADQSDCAVPPTCDSPGCWPRCLFRNRFTNILHSATVEFAAFHQVSFGPITSAAKGHLYTPIDDRQLGKLVQNEKVQLVFPFQQSYGNIVTSKWENKALVPVDTLVQIPGLYASHEVQPILEKLSTRMQVSFNETMSSLFWYARRREAPFITKHDGSDSVQSTRFDQRSPRYQCPYCHGFANDEEFTAFRVVADFNDFVEALRHMLGAHTLVPMACKIKFLHEEDSECPTIRDVWKGILKENYDAVMAGLGNGELPEVICELCHEYSR